MNNPFAAPVMICCSIILTIWIKLAYHNIKDRNKVYALGCSCMAIGAICGFIQYIFSFYIFKSHTNEMSGGFLLCRMFFYVCAALVFNYGYAKRKMK